MLDDSWDSVSSTHSNDYKIKNKTTTRSSVTTSKAKNDDKYNFPSPLHKRNTVPLDNSYDNYIFSPTNSQGSASMLPSPNDNKKKLYGYEDSPKKKDYLANFITNSADLEDSILGELLGGGKKKSTTNLPKPPEPSGKTNTSINNKTTTTKTSSSATPHKSKLQSIETEKSQKVSDKNNISTRKSKNKSPSTNRKESQKSPTKSFKSSTFQDQLHSSKYNNNNSQPSNNNFDLNESFEKDSELNSPYGRSTAGNNSPYESNNEYDDFKSNYIPTYNSNSNKEQITNNNISEDNDDDNTTGLSFIPSFMEQGRQNRRRRNLDGAPLPTTSSTNNTTYYYSNKDPNKLDDLDRALGIGLPATTVKKTISDPFSAVEKNLSSAAANTKEGGSTGSGFHIDVSDDSSSDDAILRRSRQKEYFPIATKTIVNNSSSANATTNTNKNKIVETNSSISDINNNTLVPTDIHINKSQHHQASSLPTISRSPNNAAGPGGASSLSLAMNNTSSVLLVDPGHLKDDYEDEDELDISGIVRMNIDDDLLTNAIQTSNKKDRNSFQKSKTVISNNNKNTGSLISSPTAEIPLSPRYNHTNTWNKVSYNTNTGEAIATAVASTSSEHQQPGLAIRTSITSLDNHYSNQLPATQDSNNNYLGSNGSGNSSTNGGINSFDNKESQSYKRTDGLARDRYAGNNIHSATEKELPQSSQYSYNTMKNKSTLNNATDSNINYFEQQPSATKVDEKSYSSYTKTSSNQLAQQIQNDRESLEMQQLKEVELLKLKLVQTNNMIDRADKDYSSVVSIDRGGITSQPVDFNQSNHYRYIQETNIHYAQENIEQKRTIAYLESEISRLKDEANIKSLRNHEDIERFKEKYESEISDVKLKDTIEIESLERRHEESINSLRKLHDNEIQAIKERFKSEEKFDQIAGQLRSTSGSIRFIEEQLQSRQKGVEAIREGQIDARERLLADMEEKARERADLAEAEGYRLKGILSHMEHVVNTLREQGSEEKERLRLEHSRIQARQQSFESEKTALQQRNMEELNYIKQRSKEVEIELLKLTQEKQALYETQAAIQYKLDSEKSEFAIYFNSKTKSLEIFEARLKEEEARLNRLRDVINKEKYELDERKENAVREIESAEELYRVVLQGKGQNESKQQELIRLSQSYKHASEEISQKEIAMNEQMSALQEKELAIREGFAQLKLAASELAQRERDLQHTTHYMERKKIAMDKSDNDLQAKKLAVATSFREWSSKQSDFNPSIREFDNNYRDHRNTNENPHINTDIPKILDRSYSYGKENTFVGGGTGSLMSNPVSLIHHYNNSYSKSGILYDNMNTSTIQSHPYYQTTSHHHPTNTTRMMNNYSPPTSIPPPPPAQLQLVPPPQQSLSWMDTFQAKLQLTKPSLLLQGGSTIQPIPGNNHKAPVLPIELRHAHSTLRQYKNQTNQSNHTHSSIHHVQKLINDESDFMKALQNKNLSLTI